MLDEIYHPHPNFNGVIIHKTFNHLGYMSNERYWTVIIFVIDVSITFMNKWNSDIFPSRELFMTFTTDSEI